MACRIGIATDPEERKQHWTNRHPTLKNWQILETGLSYSQAQKKENEYARKYGCQSHQGGEKSRQNNWSVYYFEY